MENTASAFNLLTTGYNFSFYSSETTKRKYCSQTNSYENVNLTKTIIKNNEA